MVLALNDNRAAAVTGAQPAAPAIDARMQEAPGAPVPWMVTLDGAVFGTVNRQGGRRGDTEFRSQNWLMAMASRPFDRSTVTLTAMVSAERLTAGAAGYSEIFQVGEAYRGLQITDRQHPHDLFMQLSAAWRFPVGSGTDLTLAGGPVGEPTLGPAAFMHRASAAENPTAPLAHHIVDSTHIASSVVMLRMDRGRFAFEGSAFHGREKNERRYDVELGALDSWAGRIWFQPAPEWRVQASHGFLHEPEALEPGNQRRTNASVSWLRIHGGATYSAFTFAVGRNSRAFADLDSVLAEGAHDFGRLAVFGRFESTGVETEILLFPQVVHRPHPGELVDTVRAGTAGVVWKLQDAGAFAIGVGADATVYGVPPLLQVTHDARPVSFHLFVRVARKDVDRRMWNHTMGAPHGTGHGHTHP